ncbi:MAG: hydroxymethylbilane synthase, partial [Mariniphaga sp.]
KLALYQAFLVQEELQKHYPDTTFIIEIIKTKGDQILDVALSKIGDKGLFTKEMETALFNGEIDMAVHSLKDLPTRFPEGAMLGAVLKRGDIRDALISLDGRKVKDLTSDDVIATSSLRRKAQLLRINPDFKIIEIRGNVNTRIRKMQEGYCNVMVMAGAGLQRLEMGEYISELFDPELMIPACSQGAIAVEIRENDPATADLVSKINHTESFAATEAERTFLGTLEGGCQIPVGSYTEIEGDKFKITGFISSIDGSKFLRESAEGPLSDAVYLSARLAKSLYNQGGAQILSEIRIETLANPQAVLTLKDKVIISTRALEASDTLPEIIRSSGAKLLSLPMIEIIPSPLDTQMTEDLNNLDSFDWIFFTSKNGVVNFFKQLIDLKGNTTLPKTLKIAVIGLKTGLELEYYGYAPTFISEENTAEEFLNRFEAKYKPANLKILLSLGNLADNTLENSFSIRNITRRINVYQTVKPTQADQAILDQIKNDAYDLIVFTSPSTFNNFCTFIEPSLLGRLKIASIGSVTTKAIQKAGFEPLFTARKSNAEGIRDAINEFYQI